MTRLLEKAVERLRFLPDAMQNEIAHVVLQLAGAELPPISLTPEEDAAIDQSLEEAERGDFASDEEVRAIWAKHGL